MKNIDLIEAALFENLPYRKELSLKGYIGTEIEMSLFSEKDKDYLLNDYLIEQGYYDPFDDSMIYGIPFEIASPKLITSKKMWEDLEELSLRMKNCQLNFDYSAFQVNIDSDLSPQELYYLILFFISYEHIIFYFSKGDDMELRPMKYAKSLRIFYNIYKDKYLTKENNLALERLMWKKNYAIAFKNNHPFHYNEPITFVEFRTPNSCNDSWLWQNYINTFYNLLHSVKRLDLDYIEYELRHNDRKNPAIMYLSDAIKFAGIIFREDLDKIYFLKHYIGKDNEKIKQNIKTISI